MNNAHFLEGTLSTTIVDLRAVPQDDDLHSQAFNPPSATPVKAESDTIRKVIEDNLPSYNNVAM